MAPVPVRSARTPLAVVAGLPAWLPVFAGILAGIALASVPVWQVLHALRANGAHGFPIDDAWIHLTFARHLHEGLGFVYSVHDPPTAGSTSPLYTAVLALCFGLTRDEKVLSYAIGIACNLVFLAALGDWARQRLGGAWWAIAAVMLVGSDMRVLILSTSGMETSLFLALVALAFAAHLRGWSWACGLAVAAAVWTRPEGILLAAVLTADAALAPGARRRRLLGVALPAAAGIASYLAFNHHLSGAWFPTTFAAKRAAIFPPVPPQSFVLHDVLPFLTDHGWIVLLPALLAGLGYELWALIRRMPTLARPETAWCLAVLAAYTVLLPTGHRFDRYLVPVLPAAALVALGAVRAFQARVQRGGGWVQHAGPVVPLVLAGAALLQISAPADAARSFTTWCHYHAVRHERAGHWLATHTPPSAVIATHDIGAIAFYSGREIVDVAGLVTPEVV